VGVPGQLEYPSCDIRVSSLHPSILDCVLSRRTERGLWSCRWHSHPSGCGPESEDCAIDAPSDTDIELFCRDGIAGNHTHMVFSRTGCFVCSLTPELRERLIAMKKGRARAIKDIGKGFDKLQDRFEGGLQDNSMTLETFRPTWLQYAKRQGFNIRFFPNGTVPWDVLHVRDVPKA